MAKGAYVGVPTKTQLVVPITAENFYQFFDRYEVDGNVSYTPGGVMTLGGTPASATLYLSDGYRQKANKLSWTYSLSTSTNANSIMPRAPDLPQWLQLYAVGNDSQETNIATIANDGSTDTYLTVAGYKVNNSTTTPQYITSVSLLFEDDDSTAEFGPSVARKVKKGYVGVDSKARKIKKAYIGVGGVARPCWSGGELSYYGTITPLSVARYYLAATTVGDYALFGGGIGNNYSAFSTVDAYTVS